MDSETVKPSPVYNCVAGSSQNPCCPVPLIQDRMQGIPQAAISEELNVSFKFATNQCP